MMAWVLMWLSYDDEWSGGKRIPDICVSSKWAVRRSIALVILYMQGIYSRYANQNLRVLAEELLVSHYGKASLREIGAGGGCAPMTLESHHSATLEYGGKGGNRTLDPGIMSAVL